MASQTLTLGFVPGDRPGFSTDWAHKMRDRCVAALKKISTVKLALPNPEFTTKGLVSNIHQATQVADQFKSMGVNRLLLGTMNFGDEEALSEVARQLEPEGASVMLFGTHDAVDSDGIRAKSDAFCGTLSASMNLHMAGVPFVFSGIMNPDQGQFLDTVKEFIASDPVDVMKEYEEQFDHKYPPPRSSGDHGEQIDAAVESFRDARLGQFGPRASGFVTCAFDERQLMKHFGQRVIPIDLAQVFGRANRLNDDDEQVSAGLKRIGDSADTANVPEAAVMKMAKLYVALQSFLQENKLAAAGHNCWTGIQTEYGICGCSVFSLLEDDGIPIACETDVYGAATMLLQSCIARAFGDDTRPHFMDWTIQHPTDPNLFQAWHCGKAPPSLFVSKPTIRSHEIIAPMLGEEISHGTLEGEIKPGEVTLCRLIEYDGEFRALVSAGQIESSQWKQMRGSWGWVRMPDLNQLYRILIEKGFSHHVSLIHGNYAQVTAEVCTQLGMEVVWVD